MAEDFETFDEYKDTLMLDCQPGDAAVLKFTPDEDTPDEIYYQVGSYF